MGSKAPHSRHRFVFWAADWAPSPLFLEYWKWRKLKPPVPQKEMGIRTSPIQIYWAWSTSGGVGYQADISDCRKGGESSERTRARKNSRFAEFPKSRIYTFLSDPTPRRKASCDRSEFLFLDLHSPRSLKHVLERRNLMRIISLRVHIGALLFNFSAMSNIPSYPLVSTCVSFINISGV